MPEEFFNMMFRHIVSPACEETRTVSRMGFVGGRLPKLCCVYSSVREVANAVGASRFWESQGFENMYHGLLRQAERRDGARSHAPISRKQWRELLQEA